MSHFVSTVIYCVLGCALFAAAFRAIMMVTPFSIRKEIEEDQNTAFAIMIGSVFLGLAIIVAAAIHS
ncbi:MAG: DUF350 domain-containing protein [Planctomycetes bacterium]|nr:DUF350 domain-containing protein [Planctomycetota bacterium]